MRDLQTRDIARHGKGAPTWFKPSLEASRRLQKLYVVAAIVLAALVPLIYRADTQAKSKTINWSEPSAFESDLWDVASWTKK